MATLSLLCRLKILSFVSSVASSNELSRSLLIRTVNENERASFSYDVLDEIEGDTRGAHRRRSRKEGWPVCTAKDVQRYELSRRILLNEGKNTLFLKVKEDNSDNSAERRRNVQKTFLFDKRSPIVSRCPLANIYHTWMFSKDSCPSTRYFCSSVRKSSNSALKLHSLVDDPTYEKFSPRERSSSRRMISPYHDNVRSYSSGKKESKSANCPVQEKQKLFEDICSERKSDPCGTKVSLNECPESSRPCKPFVEDPQPVCTTPPCPNIEDYCHERESYKEKFWRVLVCFVGLPVLIITAVYVYRKEMEGEKEPRPEYQDLPWMRRIVKPFPWGDGKHSFFHNPRKNPISPHGYEEEDPNAVRKTGQQKEKGN